MLGVVTLTCLSTAALPLIALVPQHSVVRPPHARQQKTLYSTRFTGSLAVVVYQSGRWSGCCPSTINARARTRTHAHVPAPASPHLLRTLASPRPRLSSPWAPTEANRPVLPLRHRRSHRHKQAPLRPVLCARFRRRAVP